MQGHERSSGLKRRRVYGLWNGCAMRVKSCAEK